MTEYSKFNIVYRLQKWLDSVPGQTFLNYAYSWGAAVVILGALFKLTHLPGANLMLYLGMGTEAIVFFLSAFDRPFDKTADGKDLPTHVDAEGEQTEGDNVHGVVGGGTIIIGGSVTGEHPVGDINVAGGTIVGGDAPAVIGGGGVMSPDMEEATNNYVEELKRLTEMLGKVTEQSERLTRDSEEMENLNRTLTSNCKVYELQLKGVSQQVGTIDQINDQTRRMADQITELNKIYTRMIESMTVNKQV
jgi:hypothetical protein